MPESHARAASAGGALPEDAWRRRLRLFLLRAPLLLPLLSCCGAIVGGQGWALSLAATLLCLLLHRRRLALFVLLCTAIVCLRMMTDERAREQALEAWHEAGTVVLSGTVERELSSGVILGLDDSPLRVSVHGDELSEIRTGERIRVMGELRPVRRAALPGMFDSAAWMRGQGIVASFSGARPERIGYDVGWYGLLGYCATARRLLADRIMPPGTESEPERQVLCALVLGARDRADDETMLDFRRGGCLHAFAVSGLHVGLVAMMLWPLLYALRVRPQVARPLILLLSGVYVLLTGAQAPALRAYIMLAAALFGLMLLRRISLVNIWSLAALLLLLINPYQLMQPGFQLSFGVYAAICLGIAFCRRDTPWFRPDPFIPYRIMTRGEMRIQAFDRGVRGVVVVALSAWLISVPLGAVHFHSFNPWSFLTNIAITPLLPLVMISGFALLFFGSVPWIGPLAHAAACHCCSWFIATVGFFASLPGAYIPATRAADPGAYMIMGLGYGKSSCMLGNPGILVDTGSSSSARWTIDPAVFHGGYAPAVILPTSNLRSATEGLDVLRQSWPEARILNPDELRGRFLRVETEAGQYLICGPPDDLPTRPAINQSPVLIWQNAYRRLLYLGDAAAETYERLPRGERRADVIIIGRNAARGLDPYTVQQECGARRVILLPSLTTSFEAADWQWPEDFLKPGVDAVEQGSLEGANLPPQPFGQSVSDP